MGFCCASPTGAARAVEPLSSPRSDSTYGEVQLTAKVGFRCLVQCSAVSKNRPSRQRQTAGRGRVAGGAGGGAGGGRVRRRRRRRCRFCLLFYDATRRLARRGDGWDLRPKDPTRSRGDDEGAEVQGAELLSIEDNRRAADVARGRITPGVVLSWSYTSVRIP